MLPTARNTKQASKRQWQRSMPLVALQARSSPSSWAMMFQTQNRASQWQTSSLRTAFLFVVGHYNSGVTIPASEVYAENGILFITPTATNPMVTERGLWNAFRACAGATTSKAL